MILVVGTVQLPPENLAAARDAMQQMIVASRAETGCIGYSYAEDVLVPGLIHVVETWESRLPLQQHLTTEHMATWRSRWPALGITNRQLSLFEVAAQEPY